MDTWVGKKAGFHNYLAQILEWTAGLSADTVGPLSSIAGLPVAFTQTYIRSVSSTRFYSAASWPPPPP